MWAGNVPSDASHNELWHFFNQVDETKIPSGVLSIFLISKSSCAFFNYESDADLHTAIAKFNGIPLRSHDLRCPGLVCRRRNIDDDLKAGVGGQRGVGMHTRWVRDQQKKSDLSASALSDDEFRPPFVTRSDSSVSNASTNSSLLSRYFLKRYFILKSLSQASTLSSIYIYSDN